MKKLLATTAVISAMAACSVQAHLIDLGLQEFDAVIGNPTEEAAWIKNYLNLSYSLTYLEKREDSNTFKGGGSAPDSGLADYSVAPFNNGGNADITWDLTGTGYGASYVLVKDGVDKDSKKMLYRLYEVDGSQRFIGGPDEVTINDDKNISHISWFGVPSTSVPDGGTTAAMLGLGLLGLGFAARRKE